MRAFKTISSYFFVLFICFQTLSLHAQTSAYLCITIKGLSGSSFRLDSTLYTTRDTLMKLDAGTHQLKIWAPKARIVDTTLIATEGDTIKCNFTLRTSVAYLNYQYKLAQHKARRNQRVLVSPIAVAAFCGLGIVINNKYAQKQYGLALATRDKYSSVASQVTMDEQKELFAKYKKKYKTFKAVEYSSYAVAGALTINYVRILLKQKKIIAPVWQEKSVFSRVDWFVYPEAENRSMNVGFILTLKR